ncbi:hypothetical protein E2986_12367 [Frieseomelitta varia]|uniref:Uncharacterized protein n=1 Tax=Frieseomelitta varia TaxID=561572 RepID=A0A833RML9_9HYME|nr:hypothetical protein E2986_12367 [Frieseomelitta varia]
MPKVSSEGYVILRACSLGTILFGSRSYRTARFPALVDRRRSIVPRGSLACGPSIIAAVPRDPIFDAPRGTWDVQNERSADRDARSTGPLGPPSFSSDSRVSRTLFHGEDVFDLGEFATASATEQAELIGKSETHLAAWRSDCLAFVSRESPSWEYTRGDPAGRPTTTLDHVSLHVSARYDEKFLLNRPSNCDLTSSGFAYAGGFRGGDPVARCCSRPINGMIDDPPSEARNLPNFTVRLNEHSRNDRTSP